MAASQTLRRPAVEQTGSARHTGNLDSIPVGLTGQAGGWFEVHKDVQTVVIRPTRPLPRRCTIRPAALFQQERGFPDISTIMGRLVFASGATEPQRYTPFTRDSQRTLKELFLPVEPMPDDDWLNSSVRWTNAVAITRRLLTAAGVPWKGLPTEQIQQLVAYVHCTEPVECCTLHALAQWTHERGACVIEIGSFRGRTLSALALGLTSAASNAKIISIDPHADQPLNEQQVRLTLSQLGEQRRIVQYVGSSDDAWRVLRPGSASLIFIDGDHSYRQVVNDFANYKDILAPGGCMLFHDYGFGNHSGQEDAQPDVRPAVDERVFADAALRPLLLAQVLMAFIKP